MLKKKILYAYLDACVVRNTWIDTRFSYTSVVFQYTCRRNTRALNLRSAQKYLYDRVKCPEIIFYRPSGHFVFSITDTDRIYLIDRDSVWNRLGNIIYTWWFSKCVFCFFFFRRRTIRNVMVYLKNECLMYLVGFQGYVGSYYIAPMFRSLCEFSVRFVVEICGWIFLTIQAYCHDRHGL